MIYRDLVVDIPHKKRIQKRTKYIYEILERKGSSHLKDKVVCVGISLDGKHMNPNDRYFDLHKELTRPIISIEETKEFNSSLHIGGYLLFKTIAINEGIHKLISEKFNKNTDLVLAYTYYVLLTQSSVSQHVQYFLVDNYLGLNPVFRI